MATTIGSTSSSGCPVIKIKIAGVFVSAGTEFEATVDTGFTGFLSMPLMSALPLGVTLYGTTSVQFANGSVASRFTALGIATLGDENQAGIIILEPSTTEVLVGMEFLKRFKKSVLIHEGLIVLLDEEVITKSLASGIQQAQKDATPSPSEAPNLPPAPATQS